jgi:hypothetical protein
LLLVANGLDGYEFYLAPAGLFVLALGHVFGDGMEHGGRLAVRIVGGLCFYAPAALRLSMQLTDDTTGGYAVGFGGVCLLGVVVGMVLQIRAYLALGTTFLVLDVVANLLSMSVRNHRIGFLVLSVSGIAILGLMALVSTRREDVTSFLRRLRASLRGWD